MLKWIATACNAVLLLTALWWALFMAWSAHLVSIGFMLLWLVTPIVNLLAINRRETDWLSLFFRRKTMEEQRRIDGLSRDDADD
jgi:hypothetical protein